VFLVNKEKESEAWRRRRERKAEDIYKIITVDLNVSTLIETRECDRGDSADFVLLVEETLEDELS
jgi:hypothetical protein